MARSTVAPLPAGGTQTATQIAEGHASGCEVLVTKQVACWGDAFDTPPPPNFATRPVLVHGLVNVEQVAVGFATACALVTSGFVWCWGWNDQGELGDGTYNTSTAPVLVKGVSGAVRISVGFEHGCALLASRTERCWGWNYFGQLGDGSSSSSQTSAHTVAGLRDVVQIATGYAHSCSEVANGTVWCWGDNEGGQLGNGNVHSSRVPVRVPGVTHVRSLGLGFASTCAALGDGRVLCWGRNSYGELGDGTTSASLTPVVVRGVGGATQVVVGFGHACARIQNGTARCWGWDGHGQAGTGARVNRLVGTPVRPLSGATELAAGDDATCALLKVGPFTCWGWNSTGELGDGSTAEVLRPNYLPSSPLGLTVSAGPSMATVRWHRPRTSGIGDVTGYVVTARDQSTPGHRSKTCSWTAGPLECVFTNVVNGQRYVFTVVAKNLAGYGVTSPPVRTSLLTRPGAPVVTATGGDASGTATWTRASNGGSAIVYYKATAVDMTTPANGGQFCKVTGTPYVCKLSGLLTNGDTYEFYVIAYNLIAKHVGGGPAGISNPFIPDTVSIAPSNVVAVAGNADAMVSWDAPTSDGGSALTGYTATATDVTTPANGGQTCTATPPTTTCQITGLTDGDSYTFTVTATNGAGNSSDSAPSSAVTPAGPPAPPTGVAATPGNRQASVTWVPPTVLNGSSLTGFTVATFDVTTSSAGSQTCSAAANAIGCTVPGLANGDSYTFTVAATSTAGTSPASQASTGVTPSTVPDAPTGVHATPAAGQASVSWTAPFAEGSPITGYVVTAADGTIAGNGGESCSSTPPTTNCTVTGLTNGDSYTFTVVATNGDGTGAASSASNTVVPSTGPGSPRSVLALGGASQAEVTWSAPLSDGGSKILFYSVTAADHTTPANGGENCTSTPPTTSCVVLNLTNGDHYTFTVTATNANGTSAPSGPSNTVIPSTVPDAPTGVSAVAGNTQASVSWTAPSDEGSAITGYTVTATDQTNSGNGNETCTSATTGCTVTGLANGDSYTFAVTATNADGTSAPSSPSNSVTPSGKPDPPSGVTASAGDGQASVSWTAPFDEGSPLTGYTVTATDHTNGANGGETCTSTPPTTGCTVVGLTNGDSYTFAVTATNADGTSAPSSPSNSVTPSGLPDPPTGVTASAGDGQAAIGWTAPFDGGSPLMGYTVTARDLTNASNGGETCTSTPPTTGCTIIGLTNGDTYTFTVTATNANGTSAPSSASNAVVPSTVPDAPTGVAAVAGNMQASVSWTAPFDEGSAITGYTVTATDQTNSGNGNETCTSATTGCTVTGLTNGDSYTFTVTATNGDGIGAASSPSSPVTPATVPDTPTNVTATANPPGSLSASVTWNAPFDEGSAITGYSVTATDSTNALNGGETCSASGSTTSCTVSGLTSGDDYTFVVTATNGIGPSNPSSPSNSITAQ